MRPRKKYSKPEPKPVGRLVRQKDSLSLQRLGKNQFMFVAPRAAEERVDDIDEVQQMIAGEEFDIARDELLYLVADCSGFIEAHNLLAELALEENDLKLARGHFGFGFEQGLEVLTERFNGELPAHEGYNAHFFAAGRGLARCLIALGDRRTGQDVLERLSRWDPRERDTCDLLAELAEKEKRSSSLLPILDATVEMDDEEDEDDVEIPERGRLTPDQ